MALFTRPEFEASDYATFNELTDAGNVVLRIGSHRSRDRLQSALGYMPKGYFSFYQSGEYRPIPAGDFDKVKGIPGITRARRVDGLSPCWS